MDDQEFSSRVIEQLSAQYTKTKKSTYANAKRAFSDLLARQLPVNTSLLDVFSDQAAFKRYGKQYLGALKADGIKLGTASSRKGALKVIYDEIAPAFKAEADNRSNAAKRDKALPVPLAEQFYEKSFHERLVFLCDAAWPDMNLTDRCRKLYIIAGGDPDSMTKAKLNTYLGWLRGKRDPSNVRNSGYGDIFDRLIKLEQFFAAPGLLLDTMPSGTALIQDKMDRAGLGENRVKEYPELGAVAKQQYQHLVEYNKYGNLPRLKPVFSEQHVSDLRKPNLWKVHPETGCSIEISYKARVKRYQYWLISKGHILSREEFDLSHLLDKALINDFVEDSLQKGLATSTATFLRFLRAQVCGCRSGKEAYLSIFHAPLHLGLEQTAEGYAQWERLRQELTKYIDTKQVWISRNTEQLKGNRHVRWLLDSEYRELLGLKGGVKEGVKDYLAIVDQLWKDGMAFGNRHRDVGYSALQVSLYMRLMIQTPLRIANWKQLRFAERVSSAVTATTPVIWKSGKNYRLKIPAAYVKNDRELSAELSPAYTKYIDAYLERRAWRLKLRNETSDLFFVGYSGGCDLQSMVVRWSFYACRYLWPKRDWIVRGFNAHGLRHFSATLFLADNPDQIFLLAELLADRPETVLSTYAIADKHSISKKHKAWASTYIN